jgi:hypothetical protein
MRIVRVLLALVNTCALCNAKELRWSKARDGSTEAKAIINAEKCLDEAIDMDWRYIHLYSPTFQINGASTSTVVREKTERAYQHFEFFTADGRKKDVWFDITAAFFADEKTIHCKTQKETDKYGDNSHK